MGVLRASPASSAARKSSGVSQTRRLRAASVLRALLLPALAALALPVLAVSAWAASGRLGDPVEALRRGEFAGSVVRDTSYEGFTRGGERRIFRDLVLALDSADTARVTTSRPAEAAERPLPLVFILAGLRTGRDALDVVDVHGPNLLVGYEYPYNEQTWYESAKFDQLPAIRRAVLDVPSQVVRVTDHLAAEGVVDLDRKALLGYSFGAIFVPAVQRLATESGTPFQGLVLAYGGADIRQLLEHNLQLPSRPLRRMLAWMGASLLHPMEPEHHLPHLSGRFLLIRGELDQKIPRSAALRMAELTPEPKHVVALEDGHMGPGNPELTARIVRLSQEWLIENGLIDWEAGGEGR